MRQRTKLPYRTRYYINGSLQSQSEERFAESMVESKTPGPCDVEHHLALPWSTYGVHSNGDRSSWVNFPAYVPPIPPLPTRLDWDKLPSSSDFGIIQFFAELDDTIAMFSMKFLKELSYGSFTWGVLPFVNDIKAILETVANYQLDHSMIVYEDSWKEQHDFHHVDYFGDVYSGIISLEYRLTGFASLEGASEARLWLDRLGLHPDLGTAWDLIPMSFVVDWLLPVGDFLDRLKGGGWVRSADFIGWQSVKYTVEGNFRADPTEFLSGSSEYYAKGYKRSYANVPLLVEPRFEPPELKVPSFRNLFNMAYLAGNRPLSQGLNRVFKKRPRRR